MNQPHPDENRSPQYPGPQNSGPHFQAQPYGGAPNYQGGPYQGQPGYQAQPYHPGAPQPGYAQAGYPQPGYAQPGYAEPGYTQPGYPQPGSHGPVYQARFRKHTGMIILAQWRDVTVTGSYEQIRQAYRAAQTHNLLAGWWGLISFFVYNWIALIGNISEMGRIKQLARQNGEQV
jgi:hypothetical protein